MKKLLFTFFAIITLSAFCYAETGVLTATTKMSDLNWPNNSDHPTLQVGSIQFVCTNGTDEYNGRFIKGSTSDGNNWRLYYSFSYGEVEVKSRYPTSYMVKDVTFTYSAANGGVLTAVKSSAQQSSGYYASGSKISIEGTKKLYVGHSTSATTAVYLMIKQVDVTYYKLPASIALSSSEMSLTTIGQTSTLTVTATPSDAYAGCSWESSNTAVATVDKTGKVTAVAVGTATITAKSVDGTKTATCAVTVWGDPTASFADGTVVSKNIGDPAFTNALTTQSTGAVTYSSSDESVATVDANGQVTIVNGGSTKITASIAKKAPYNAKEIFYTLDVSHTPEANKYWTEDFSNVSSGSTTGAVSVDGKAGVYKWSLTNYQRSTDDMVNGEQGMRLRYPSVWTMVNPEGGIKEVAFDWRASGKDNVVHFWVGPEGNEYEYSRVAVGSNTTVMHFARQFDVDDNVALKFRMSGAAETPTQTYAIIGPVKIVPYLLYTVKSDTAKVSSKSRYLPAYLIKNTPNNAVISYSSSNPEVDVDEFGSINVSKAFDAPVTITATWGNVSTSFSLLIQNKEICQASFASSKVSVARGETPANNLTIQTFSGETAPEVVYVSSNPEVATIGANNTITTLAPGKTTITAQIGETDMHLAGSASYELTVTYTPTAGTYWTETFSDAGDINTYATKTIDGDDGTEDKWTLNNVMRHQNDLVGSERGIRLQYSSTIASNVTLEGGIKEVIFNWRPLNNGNIPHFYVQVGNDSPHSITIPQKTTDVQAYAHIFNKKSNTSLTIGNYAQEPTAQGYVVIGEVKVIPYLLFKGNKQVDIDLDNVKSFNLSDTLLNSTEGGTIAFAVDSFKTDVAPTITNGVVDFSSLSKGGKVYISATWNENQDVKTTLVLQTATTPDVSFADAGPIDKTIGDASFTNALTPMEGLGEITYSSLNTSVATVDAASGLVTLVSSGTATIQATVAASDIYKETSTTYQLNVAGYTPETGKSWVETFSRLSKTSGYVSDEQSFMGDSLVYGWKINNYNRPNKDNPFRMQTNGYIKMNGNQEGGIKYAQLNWKPSWTDSTNFIMAAGEQSCPFEGAVTKDQPYVFEHFFNIKENTSLSVTMGSTGVKANMQVVNITIVPYLLYTTKSHSMNMNEGATYKNESLIDNRDDEVAITYESSDDAVATVAADGTVTAKKAGTVTITAKWGDVSTSYKLTISAKTAISFVRNDGTEDVDVVDNNVGEAFPSFTIPTRTGYRFNAYWTAADTAQGYRFTITALNGNTGWVAGRQIGQDKFTDSNRKWIYGGATYTFYAQWMPELTIVLENQGATTAGTEQVITAKCENNNSVNLQNSNIEVPEKDNCTFMGYYTEAEGQGSKLIDASGAFIASVTGYTNEYKMWQQSTGTTLYAYWKEGIILNDTEDNAQKIAVNAGKTMDVTTNRHITANMYNTICLPFDVDEDQMEAIFGNNYKLVEFTKATLAGDVLTIYFNEASTIEAGKPYLIKTSKDTSNIAFHDVEIVNTTGESSGEGDFLMYGVINPTCVNATETSHLIVVANDNLSWITAGDTEKVKGMRAYFQVNGPMQAAIRKVNPRLAISDVNTPTDLVNANANVNVNCKVMMNDKLYILRNGRYYDVLGK